MADRRRQIACLVCGCITAAKPLPFITLSCRMSHKLVGMGHFFYFCFAKLIYLGIEKEQVLFALLSILYNFAPPKKEYEG